MGKDKDKDKSSKSKDTYTSVVEREEKKYVSEGQMKDLYKRLANQGGGKREEKIVIKKQEQFQQQQSMINLGLKPSREEAISKAKRKYVGEKASRILSGVVSKFTKGRFLKRPTARITPISPVKVLTGGMGHHALVNEGRMGTFNDEYEKEIKWLN